MARLTTPREYRALAELRYRIRLFLAFSEGRARQAGMEPGQHQLLLTIEGLPKTMSPTIGAVAERLGVQHHSAVEMASRAARAGLVKRARGAADQRVVTLAVTPRGKRLLAKLSGEHRLELRSAAPALVKALRATIRGTA